MRRHELRSVFELIDSQTRSFRGFNPVAILWNTRVWRKYFTLCVAASLSAWVTLGFESTWEQLEALVFFFPCLFTGESFTALWSESRIHYGTGNHFSSPVIYGLAFILLSRYFESIGIHKSLNFLATTALSLMNIGVFEWAYNILYANLQNQPWTVQFQWKQVTNLFQFTLFIFVGAATLLYLHLSGYRPNLGRRTRVFALFSACAWLVWIFFPFPVNSISVPTTVGTWTNSSLFPQTMWVIDLDPTDGIAIGCPYFAENNLLHGINLLAKIFTTAAIFSLCKVRKNG